jgi:cytochrome c oxidase cbb3-type subunit 3/ubiquinol-cytochrome c reductase cytochrome c subunit
VTQQEHRPKDAATADANPANLDGAQLYGTFCAQCHGADAKGYKADNAPSLVNKTFLESAGDDYLHRSIAAGRPGTSMAAYSAKVGGPLDDAAIDRIVGFLRAQGPQAMALPPTQPGDSAAGQNVYNQQCLKCHGDMGTRGSAVHLANQQFQAIASDPFIRYAVVNGRPGTPMVAFGQTLTPEQIDDVVAYVRTYKRQIADVGELPPPTGKEPLILNPKGKDPVWKKLRRDPGATVDRYVSVDELKAALAQKRKLVVIDARPASDWMRVHVEGAVSIPYHDTARLAEIPNDVWVVAYCACPHHLSGVVVDELIKRGHKKALVLDEGILEWHRRGYPVVAAPGVQPPPKEGGVQPPPR